MPPDPEEIEAMLERMRRMREEYGAHAERLRESGLEVDGFLADCDEFIAVLEGRHEGEFDVEAFQRRLKAFIEETKEFMHIQRQVKAAELAGDLHSLPEMMEGVIADLRKHGGAGELRAAAEIEASLAKFQSALAEGRVDKEALADIMLAAAVQKAEMARRLKFRSVGLYLYWESWPPERWAALPGEEQAKLQGFLAQWREEKEKVLGELPLEDRRRLEAMRYEDFDQPGALEP